MDARAWRIAGGAAVALLVLVALVAWRADALSGAWLLALRVTGLVAVVGLLAAVVLASLAALRPPTPPQVLVTVPLSGAPSTTTAPGRAAVVPLAALVLLAVVSSAPALVVLVLARGDASDLVASEQPAPGQTSPTATASTSPPPPSPSVTSAAPATSSPSTASPSPQPTASTAPSTAPSTGPAGGAGEQPPPVAPSQLPSEAASGVVCEVVVAAGDSLWSLASAQLGPQATDADVDARWRALYAQNAGVVGADPDLLLPGQQLRSCS